MPATVPTQAEFDARLNSLEARVTALENTQPPVGPVDPPVDPGVGVQAKRVAQLIETFGVNTFSTMDEHNSWGSWPADYQPESVIAALRYLTADTRFCLPLREYHYKGREEFQLPWLQAITGAFPDAHVTICVGANGSTADVGSMVTLPADWLEGLNEPNTDFGSGMVPVTATAAIQEELTKYVPVDAIMGPSIVAGMPGPEGWIYDYCGSSLDRLNQQMGIGNGHYYPPHCPDLIGDGTSLSEYVGGLWTAYNQHPIAITEFHPSLYNSDGHKPDQIGWSGERDAYYTILALYRAAKCTVTGLWWYALFDYGNTYQCGLFHQSGTDQPRPAATAIHNLCRICADAGSDMYDFTPGKLQVNVTGPSDNRWDWDLYQASDGTFYIPLWRAGADQGGAPVPIELQFEPAPRGCTMYEVITGVTLPFVTASDSPQRLVVDLDASVRMLVVRY